MANRILTGAVVGVAVVFGNGCLGPVHPEAEPWIIVEQPSPCGEPFPQLAGEYRCHNPTLPGTSAGGVPFDSPERYSAKMSQETNAQGQMVYTYAREGRFAGDGRKVFKFIPDGVRRQWGTAHERLKRPLYVDSFCRGNSLVSRRDRYYRDGAEIGIDMGHFNALLFTPRESGDLDIEIRLYSFSELINSYSVDCKRKPDSSAGLEPDSNVTQGEPDTSEPQATENALGLTRAQRRRIQETLAAQGFNPGAPDGIFGPRTREAIRGWQAGRGADATGYLTARQSRALQE